MPASSWTPAHFHGFLFVWALGLGLLGMGQGPGEVGGKGLQEAWTTLAGVVGRERSLKHCKGLEFEDYKHGAALEMRGEMMDLDWVRAERGHVSIEATSSRL